MLKYISPLISPELLKCLAQMGHGDTIVIGVCNYPATSTCNKCVRADGVKATDLVAAILEILPLDVDEPGAPVTLMESTDHPDMRPEIWDEFEKIVLEKEPKATFDSNIVHLRKISIIGSNAIPALYFPRCIDLLEAGMVDVKSLISHRFKLEDLPTAMAQYLAEKDKAVKAIMVNE